MHRLPADFEFERLIGRTLSLVSFSANTIDLSFDNDTRITILSAYRQGGVTEPDDDTIHRVPVMESQLMQLTEAKVTEATADESGTLCLVFDSSQKLWIYNDSKRYECYQIYFDGKMIVV